MQALFNFRRKKELILFIIKYTKEWHVYLLVCTCSIYRRLRICYVVGYIAIVRTTSRSWKTKFIHLYISKVSLHMKIRD